MTKSAKEVQQGQMNKLIHRIHSATGNDDKWSQVLTDIKNLFKSTSVTIARHYFDTGYGERIYQSPIDEKRSLQYNEKFCVRNPWFLSSSEYTAGRVMTGDELIDVDDLIKSDYYQQYLKPHGLLHRLCGVIAYDTDHTCIIAVHRGAKEPQFDTVDKALMKSILDHLSISFINHWKLLNADGINQIFLSIIDHFDNAAFLVEPDCTVIYKNRYTEEFMERIGGLTILDNKVRAMTKNDQRLLQASLDEMAHTATDDLLATSKNILLSNANLKQQIIVTLRNIGSLYCMRRGKYKKVLILTARDPTTVLHPHYCAFPNLYNLTPAQTRLSALIFSGCSLSDIAERLHLSDNTIRSHLKQIYLKTDTHSQIDLVQLHVRICDEHF